MKSGQRWARGGYGVVCSGVAGGGGVLFVGKKPEAAKGQQPQARHSGVGKTTVDVTPGEAGGVIEETLTTSATVARRGHGDAQDHVRARGRHDRPRSPRPPEMRNIDQLRAGDRVKATVLSRINVFVDNEGPDTPARKPCSPARRRGPSPAGCTRRRTR